MTWLSCRLQTPILPNLSVLGTDCARPSRIRTVGMNMGSAQLWLSATGVPKYFHPSVWAQSQHSRMKLSMRQCTHNEMRNLINSDQRVQQLLDVLPSSARFLALGSRHQWLAGGHGYRGSQPPFNKDFSCNQDLFASAGALDLSLFTQSGHWPL